MTPQPGAIVRVTGHPGLVGLVTTLAGMLDDWEWLKDEDGDLMRDGFTTVIVIISNATDDHSPGCVYNVGADHLEVVGQLEGVECE